MKIESIQTWKFESYHDIPYEDWYESKNIDMYLSGQKIEQMGQTNHIKDFKKTFESYQMIRTKWYLNRIKYHFKEPEGSGNTIHTKFESYQMTKKIGFKRLDSQEIS